MHARPLTVLALAIGFASASVEGSPAFMPKNSREASSDSPIAEKLADTNAALLASWTSGVKGDGNRRASTTFRVERVVKGDAQSGKGENVTIRGYTEGSPGDLFLIFFTRAGPSWEWSPIRMKESALKYTLEAPPTTEPAGTRLAYFAKFLENPDPVIAEDAWAEFINADFKDVAVVAKDFPRDKLHKWFGDPEISSKRQGLYAMMLGICGSDDDAKLLERKIVEPTDDVRPDIDRVIMGYLLLTGDKGLAVIDREKIERKRIPFSETYYAMLALQFMWTNGNGRIEAERLRQSMRRLLERPELADLAIYDLARWKDWTVRGRLVQMYDSEEFKVPAIRRAIVRYLLACSHDASTPDGTPNPAAADAKQLLDGLRKKDPKTVSEVEQYFVSP